MNLEGFNLKDWSREEIEGCTALESVPLGTFFCASSTGIAIDISCNTTSGGH